MWYTTVCAHTIISVTDHGAMSGLIFGWLQSWHFTLVILKNIKQVFYDRYGVVSGILLLCDISIWWSIHCTKGDWGSFLLPIRSSSTFHLKCWFLQKWPDNFFHFWYQASLCVGPQTLDSFEPLNFSRFERSEKNVATFLTIFSKTVR